MPESSILVDIPKNWVNKALTQKVSDILNNLKLFKKKEFLFFVLKTNHEDMGRLNNPITTKETKSIVKISKTMS